MIIIIIISITGNRRVGRDRVVGFVAGRRSGKAWQNASDQTHLQVWLYFRGPEVTLPFPCAGGMGLAPALSEQNAGRGAAEPERDEEAIPTSFYSFLNVQTRDRTGAPRRCGRRRPREAAKRLRESYDGRGGRGCLAWSLPGRRGRGYPEPLEDALGEPARSIILLLIIIIMIIIMITIMIIAVTILIGACTAPTRRWPPPTGPPRCTRSPGGAIASASTTASARPSTRRPRLFRLCKNTLVEKLNTTRN